MRFFRHVLSTVLAEMLIVALNLLLGVLTARVLGPSRRGILTLVMTLPLTVIALADPGISQANIYFIGRKERPPSTVASNSVIFAIVIGAVVAAVLWLVRGLALRTVLRSMPAHYLTLVICLVPLLLLHSYWMAVLRARQRFELFNTLRLAMPVALLVLMGLALLVFHGGIGWATAAYGTAVLISAGGSSLLIAILIRLRFRADWQLMRASLGYGFKSYLQDALNHLTYRLDVYLVALFLSAEEIAFYAIATSVAEMAWYIPNSVGMVLFPKLSAAAEHDIHEVTAEVCRHTLALTILAGVLILAVGVFGIPLLYGHAYGPAVVPLVFLMPGVVVMTLYKVLIRNFSSRNRQQISIGAAAIGLFLNVGLDLLLIPRLGLTGAAVASSLSYSAAGLALLWAFRRESGLSLRRVLWLYPTDLGRYRDLVATVKALLADRVAARQ